MATTVPITFSLKNACGVLDSLRVPLTLSSSLPRLQTYVVPFKVAETVTFFENVWDEIAILAQYRRLFPLEFAVSEERLERTAEELYSPRELEAVRLVNQRLFPVNDDEYEYNDERSLYIPIMTFGIDAWGDYDMRPGWCLIAFLAGGYDASYIRESFATWNEAQIADLEGMEREITSNPDYDQLDLLCHRESAPLDDLVVVLRMFFHETNTTWLDPYPEQPLDDPYWNDSAAIDMLAAEWQVANEIMNRADQFLDWLEADPLPRLREVVNLWKQALRPR